MQEFFYMDGKAVFVWGAYGITAIALLLSIAAAIWRKRKIVKEIKASLEE